MQQFMVSMRCKSGHDVADRIEALNAKSAFEKALKYADEIFGKEYGEIAVSVYAQEVRIKEEAGVISTAE